MASPHPNSIFRWEDAASLEHSCWQCPTKANSPRALQTCYGTHSMPCTAYHPTMHAVGAAHRCSGCVNGKEMHDARHKEIAELVAEFKALQSHGIEPSKSKTPLLERHLNTVQTPKKERNGTTRQSTTIHEGDDEDDTTSLSSYTPSIGPFRKLTKAEQRTQKKAKRDAKSQSKALKNQTRHLAGVSIADVEAVAQILHGDCSDAISDGSAHPLATDKNIEEVIARNLNFVKSIEAHKSCLFKSIAIGRHEQKERKRQKKRECMGEESVEMEHVVTAILVELGIPSNIASMAGMSAASHMPTQTRANQGRKRASSGLTSPACPSNFKEGIAIAKKLRNAVKDDLEKHENEIHARYVRAGGFWRYVGKTVFERMAQIAGEIDVSSGERWDKRFTGRDVGTDHESKSSGPSV